MCSNKVKSITARKLRVKPETASLIHPFVSRCITACDIGDQPQFEVSKVLERDKQKKELRTQVQISLLSSVFNHSINIASSALFSVQFYSCCSNSMHFGKWNFLSYCIPPCSLPCGCLACLTWLWSLSFGGLWGAAASGKMGRNQHRFHLKKCFGISTQWLLFIIFLLWFCYLRNSSTLCLVKQRIVL